ncbi:GNAT family N-acetyltransferase [soil metagenome]
MFQPVPSIQNNNSILNIEDGIKIITAETDADYEAAKQLFIAYQQFLGEDLCFQSFDAELMKLPIMYAATNGALLLAIKNGEYIGCVAFRKTGDDVCEIKRLYVTEAYKQQGIGRLLVDKIIATAKEAGYKKMILDTLNKLQPALNLYYSFGFKETTAYYPNPLQGVIYMELNLAG